MRKEFRGNTENYVICIDMDDTVEELLKPWVNWLNKKYNLSVNYKDIDRWEISGFFPDLTWEQIYEPLDTDDFWDTVEPKKDAVKYVKMLKDEGFQVYICTHSYYKSLSAKMNKVLFKYFPYLTWNDVIVIHHKQLVNCDVLVDDGPHNLENGKYHKILINTGANAQYHNSDFIRADNWREIYSAIHTLFDYDNLRWGGRNSNEK